jgi:Skp family chaperone for outer membrane proteins
MKPIWFAFLPFSLLVSCASAPMTPQEKIASVGRSFVESNKQINQADKDLNSFEKNVSELRETALNSKNMRSKSDYDSALSRLENRIAQTRVDLQSLKDANQQGAAEYKRQLESAATEIQQSSNSNQNK